LEYIAHMTRLLLLTGSNSKIDSAVSFMQCLDESSLAAIKSFLQNHQIPSLIVGIIKATTMSDSEKRGKRKQKEAYINL
jgi:hypothetical protein